MRQGAALPAVLLALTFTSAIAVGGAFVARQHASAARFADRGSELQPMAELALVEAIARWDSVARTAQPIGSITALPLEPATPRTNVWITRATPRLYWLVAEASSGPRPVLRRRIGVLVRDSSGTPQVIPLVAWAELP